MNTTAPPRETWALSHAWRGESDKAALALCAAELDKLGIAFADAPDLASADAVKMHGFEIVDALHAGQPRLADLRDVAGSDDWRSRIDPRPLRFMEHGGAVHGIPVGIHQSNCLWAHAPIAASVAAEQAGRALDLMSWLRAAARHATRPLAIGGDPWSVGILMESVLLATAGPQVYERAFVRLEPGALGGREMIQALERLAELRDFVDDERLARPWRSQLDDVRNGEAAVMVMGDWVGARLPESLVRLRVDGFRDECIFIADFFVPLHRDGSTLARRVAAALTGTDFQARFSKTKGCLAAVLAAQGATPESSRRIDAPSLTLDQCCSVPTKTRLLAIVADHFVHRRDAARTATTLAGIASP